ncbi:MAG: META domain-containing protein [Methanoregula sp.]|nr:META domain-containing protein [Methanoregula sp.]
MRSSGAVLIILMAGFVLVSGCADLAPVKTPDAINTGQTSPDILSSRDDTASSLVKPWYVKALITNGTPNVPVRLTGIQLNFYNNGSFDGFDSCNPYTGRWRADEKHVIIGQIQSPEHYCNEPPGVMEQESEYFALLRNASRYLVSGEDMVLSDDTGKNGLVFKQVFF